MTPTELDGRQVMVAARAHLEADAAATLRDANRRGGQSCALAAEKTGKRKTCMFLNQRQTSSLMNAEWQQESRCMSIAVLMGTDGI